ncbi:testis-expressed protein 12 [Chaetodon trifascialis]|uniref:testis-expressed protein 12 n=1 Tax=Chaetodon trifascialis TaxID=109706 RepID=UPI0039949674
MAGKLIPPVLNKRAANNNKDPIQTTPQEMECTSADQDRSPPKKKKTPSKPSMLKSADLFEVTAAGTSREVSKLFSEFAEVLSERAAADASQMKELDVLLAEAQNLESYLKEKKIHLKQTLALISDKLQG